MLSMGRAVRARRFLNVVLLLLAGLYAEGVEKFPVKRPLVDLHESALQLVSREGPRYPGANFLSDVRTCRAPHDPTREADSPDSGSATPSSDGCMEGYAVLTMANDVAMQQLVPLLLESLNRIAGPDLSNLAKHTTVVAVTNPALDLCKRMVRRFRHTCTLDEISGLYDGDNRFPGYKALAFGMAKLKYIVNALTTNTGILYVDADVVFLRNPFPDLLRFTTDIAVATAPAPCGSSPTAPPRGTGGPKRSRSSSLSSVAVTAAAATTEAGVGLDPTATNSTRSLQQASQGYGQAGAAAGAELFSTGITFFRSSPGALRCAYSVLLDLALMARRDPGGLVWEQERFAAFVPSCADALGLGFRVLRPPQYVTSCGPRLSEEVRREAFMVHAAMEPGSSLGSRAPLMKSLLGVETEAEGQGAEGAVGDEVDAGAAAVGGLG